MSFEDNNPFAADRPVSFLSDHGDEEEDAPTTSDVEAAEAPPVSGPGGSTRYFQDPASRITMLFRSSEPPAPIIQVIDAGKSMEGSGNYVTYSIKVGDFVVRRRYSEFDSLRTSLMRVHPTAVVPPLPEKQTISDYAAIGASKHRADQILIEHRKRMLQQFLTRCARHPKLRSEPVFHKFLDSNVSWSEVLTSPPLSLLPKNILQAPPLDPVAASDSLAHTSLPTPSPGSRPRHALDPAEQVFLDAELKAKEYETLIQGGIEKCNRRILKRLSDLSNELNDLGAAYNSFSLLNTGPLAAGIERIGQVSDQSFVLTTELVHALSVELEEPFEESAQIAHSVRQLLKYRRSKQLQLSLTEKSLVQKRHTLESLERSENEAKRIEGALGGRGQTMGASSDAQDNDSEPIPEYVRAAQQHASVNGGSGTSPKKSGFRVFGKLNSAIHGMMDVDPEVTRRNNIGKTQEKVALLEQSLEIAKTGAKQASESIKDELALYEETRTADLEAILERVGRCYIQWAEKSLQAWEDAQREIAHM